MLTTGLKINDNIIKKLKEKHNVTIEEVYECFLNRTKGLLEDKRLDHKTNPPTLWFIAETDHGRLLKIVYIELTNDSYVIKTAFEPSNKEVRIYEQYA